MRNGRSMLVITVGAILTFAVTRSPSWLNVHTVGEILIASGTVAVVLGQARRLHRRAGMTQRPREATPIQTSQATADWHASDGRRSVGLRSAR